MNFELTADEKEFRAKVCSFIRREITDEIRLQHFDPEEQNGWSVGFAGDFRRRLGAEGYIGMGWPDEDVFAHS